MENLPIGAKIEDGQLWCQILNRIQGIHKAALFLDRDGVIVQDTDYLHRPEDVNLIAGVAKVLSKANRFSIPVIIVTNQAGIARGKYGWSEFNDVQEKIIQTLNNQGAFINAVFACPHHADGNPPFKIANHPWRKPNPGMLIEAAQRLSIDLQNSWIIGDKASDIQAGHNAGLMGGIHLLTGHGKDPGERKKALELNSNKFKCLTADNIADTEDMLTNLLDI